MKSALRSFPLRRRRCCPTIARSSFSTLTPEEAGRRAEAMAHRMVQQQQQQQQHTTSMDTVLAHAGVRVDQANGALSPPLHLATTYARPAEGPYHETDSIYTRHDNPTRLLLEREMARLEVHPTGSSIEDPAGDTVRTSMPSSSTEHPSAVATETIISCAFASGMMAASAIVLTHRAPLCVLLPLDLYHGVPTVLLDVFARFQVKVQRVDMRKLSSLSDALLDLPRTMDAIVWLETPSNPLCHVVDIATTCDLVKSVRPDNTSVVVDSTLAPPTLTQPLLLGADFCMHSCTKYVGGHSDVLLGVVTASPFTDRGRELGPVLRSSQIAVGGVASAMDSWLTLRGLRTLAVRVRRQCDTAMKLAYYLVAHPSISAVHYPGLQQEGSEDQYEIAKRQMKGGFGGVLSVELDSESQAMAFAGALKTIQRATSLGGTETLIEHRASIEPPGRVSSPPGLLRIAVGLEDADDLLSDIDRALEICLLVHE